MTKLRMWKRGLSLLDQRERWVLALLISLVVIAGLSSALMVASVLPFLTVISDPTTIQSIEQLSWAYDRFGFSSEYQFLIALGVASIAIILFANLIQILKTFVLTRFCSMRVHSISRRLLWQYLRQPYPFHLSEHSSQMSTKILNESTYVVKYFFRPAADVVSAIFTVCAVGVVVVAVDPLVAVFVCLIFSAVYFTFYWVTRKRLAALGVARATQNKERFRVVSESLSGIKNIKLFDSEPSAIKQYDKHCRIMVQSEYKLQLLTEIPQYVIQTVAFSGVVLLCLFLLEPETLASGSSLRELIPMLGVFAFAGQRLLPELSRIYRGFSQLKYGQAAVDNIYDDLLLQLAPLPENDHDAVRLRFTKQLTLESVCYQYPESEQLVLDDVSVSIKAGEKIGIVGGSGAGKSTLADIILGLLPPTSGEIRVDDKVLVDSDFPAWRQTVSYVPQDVFLLDASVSENITLGTSPESLDQTQLHKAIKYAQLEDVIDTLQDGPLTAIGEGGIRLSGGQRQRLGIARALYRDSDLILFDEATSALDNLTEAEVMASIEGLPGDKTILMIAHRLSTVRHCDRIVLMDSGKIVGFDTWENLEKENSFFRNLISPAKSA